MMEKTAISKQVGVVLVAIAIILGFSGPAASASKSDVKTKSRGGQTIRFEPYVVAKKKFSSRTQKPRLSSAQKEKLFKAGYAMIGKIEVEHKEKECYEGKKCKTIYRGKDQPTTALLKEAARQGADLVVMKKNNVRTAVGISKRGECIDEMDGIAEYSVPIVNYSGEVIGMEMKRVPTKVCVEWERIRGKTHTTRSSAILWRKEPELAQAQLSFGTKLTSRQLLPAARSGNLAWARTLLLLGADLNQKDKNGDTPLHLAARNRHTAIVELLTAKGANVNTKDKYGNTPLHTAPTLEMAKLLIAKGAKVNVKSKYGYRPLHRAAEYGNTAVVKLLIASGADINARTKKDWTPLMSAVDKNRIKTVKLLLANGADPNIENRNGWTQYEKQNCCNALDIALNNKHTGIARELEKWGAKGTERREAGIRRDREREAVRKVFETPREQLALVNAAAEGRLADVRGMLDGGMDPNGEVGFGKPSALYAACEAGHLAVASLLLERGADLDHKITTTGDTPLIVAAKKGHTEIVRALLDKGADVNQTSTLESTALGRAALYGHADTVRLLLSRGADPNHIDLLGDIPLHGVAYQGHVEVAELLISAGTDVNAKDEEIEETPLHRAAKGGRTTMAKFLIAKGANINAKNNKGKTPLRLAKKNKHKEMVKLLKQYGGK